MRLPEAVTPEEKSAYAMALNPYAHALPAAANGVGDASRQYLSTVTVDGRSVSFTGRDIGNVDERMPFVYDIAQAFMSAVSAGSTNGLSAQQRVYQDQRQMIQRVWGTEVWRQDPRRATTPQR